MCLLLTLIPVSVLLKRYYAYFVIQNRERLQFYPKSPNMQTLILVIEAHLVIAGSHAARSKAREGRERRGRQ